MRFGIRDILFMLVLLAVPLAAFKFVFMPRNQEIALAKQEINDKREKLDQLRDASGSIDNLGKAIDALQEAVTLIEAKLPPENKVDEVLRQAWEIAEDQNLVNKGVEPDDAVPASRYKELPIEVELEGGFDGFYSFLLALEQLPRLTRIKDLKIERLDTEQGSMKAEFTLSIYFQPVNTKSQTLAGV